MAQAPECARCDAFYQRSLIAVRALAVLWASTGAAKALGAGADPGARPCAGRSRRRWRGRWGALRKRKDIDAVALREKASATGGWGRGCAVCAFTCTFGARARVAFFL